MCDENDSFKNEVVNTIYEDARYIHRAICAVYRINIDGHDVDERLNIKRITICKILKDVLENKNNLPDGQIYRDIQIQFNNICLECDRLHSDEKGKFSKIFYELISSGCNKFPELNFTPSFGL
ncbi:hypothetical protein [Acetobacter sp.]|uniref:hypothetical protein n=1 Tax=Acetobacter sp. TaxID=440 RepID=UPI0039E82CED